MTWLYDLFIYSGILWFIRKAFFFDLPILVLHGLFVKPSSLICLFWYYMVYLLSLLLWFTYSGITWFICEASFFDLPILVLHGLFVKPSSLIYLFWYYMVYLWSLLLWFTYCGITWFIRKAFFFAFSMEISTLSSYRSLQLFPPQTE